MRKYWLTFVLALQTEMQYRANLVMWLVVGAIGPLIMTLVWFTVLGDKHELAGYDRGDFVSYYLLMTYGWYVIGGSFSRALARSIKNGEINKTLLKPYSVTFGAFVSEQAWKATSLFVTLPVLAVLIYVLRDYVSWDNWGGGWTIAPAIILGATIFALVEACVGTLAYWVTEIWPFADMYDILLHLLGGTLAPVALLPTSLQVATEYLPFRYIFYEPINMILGKVSNPGEVLFKQAVFVVLLYGLYRLMWGAGIKKYEAIGG